MESCLIAHSAVQIPRAGGASQRSGVDQYLWGRLFLSEASVVHLRLAIGRISSKSPIRHDLDKWLDGIVANFSDTIHPVDAQVASRAGAIMRHPIRRLHDALLVATAQVHGHDLLTLRGEDFEPWAKVTLVTCSEKSPTPAEIPAPIAPVRFKPRVIS